VSKIPPAPYFRIRWQFRSLRVLFWKRLLRRLAFDRPDPVSIALNGGRYTLYLQRTTVLRMGIKVHSSSLVLVLNPATD